MNAGFTLKPLCILPAKYSTTWRSHQLKGRKSATMGGCEPVWFGLVPRLDYCNSLLMSTPNSVIQPMQKIQNAAARLILRAPRHQRCTPLPQQLHWLPIFERIKYKTACMCYNSITSSAPSYLSEYCSSAALPALSALHQTHAYSNSDASTAKLSAFALSSVSVLISGTTSSKMP